MKPTPLLLITAATALLLSSCANPSHLIVFQHSNLGVNAGVSPATNNFHLRVGARREFAIVAPKYHAKDPLKLASGEDPVDNTNVASSYVAARMRVINPWTSPEVHEVLATGDAAVLAASDGKIPRFVSDNTQPAVPEESR